MYIHIYIYIYIFGNSCTVLSMLTRPCVLETRNIRQRQNTSEVSRREYEVSDRIRLKPHPCLVQLFLVHNFRDAGLYVLVMEFCSGGDPLSAMIIMRLLTGSPYFDAYPPNMAPDRVPTRRNLSSRYRTGAMLGGGYPFEPHSKLG